MQAGSQRPDSPSRCPGHTRVRGVLGRVLVAGATEAGASRAAGPSRQPSVMRAGRERERGRPISWPTALQVAAAAILTGGVQSLAATGNASEFFESRIRPLLSEHCFACHSSRVEAPFAGLRLDSRDAMLRGGDSGPVVEEGAPERSRLVSMLHG